MEFQQNASYGQGMDLDKNIAYNQHTGLKLKVSQPVDSELQQNIGQTAELEQNVAYGQPTELEQNISYDQPTEMKQNTVYSLNRTENIPYEWPDTMRSDCELSKGCDKNVVNKNSKKGVRIQVYKNGFKASTITASIALVLSLLALLAAVVAIFLGAHEAELATSSSQEISILQNQLSLQNETVAAALTITLARFLNPVRSCKDVPQGSPSGDYWIQADETSSPVQVYCDMNRTSCNCNTTGGWMRVANLDMTDPNQNCPAGFQQVVRTSAPLRTCGRSRSGSGGCTSIRFPTYGVKYSHVCGLVIGYQDGSPDAFGRYFASRETAIDSIYVDGVSLTHGQSPRKHIWTFVGALQETGPDINRISLCPCTQLDVPYIGTIPSIVGQDYFCDTGSRSVWSNIFYPDDPLWDGHGCGSNSTCCEFNNPPWFCKQLPQPTTDDIELRLCGDEPTDNEDTPLEQVEIYTY